MTFFEAVFFFFYRFLFMPILLTLAFFFVAPFNKKVRRGLELRKLDKLKTSLQNRPLWIHASSGEFEYAKPIVTQMKLRHPDIPVVVTYFSPSYESQIKKFAGVDLALALPLDLPGPVREFLNRLGPRALIVARTDLWPELLYQVRSKKIPALLFSCTFREVSGRRSLTKPYFRFLFSQFKSIFAVSDLDKKHILSTGLLTSVETHGDTRFDQVVARLQNPKPIRAAHFTNKNIPILICGSTWPEDELVILEAASQLIKEKKLRVVLVPHEIDEKHLMQIEAQLRKYALEFSRYSAQEDWSNGVLVVDEMGILAELYTIGQMAFVGGSFREKVHSVMEPLAAGLPTLVGPFYKNNREAIEFKALGFVISATNEVEFKASLEGSLATLSADQSKRIRDEVMRRTGGTKQVIQWLENNILK